MICMPFLFVGFLVLFFCPTVCWLGFAVPHGFLSCFFFWSVWLRILDAMHAVSQYGHLSVRSYPISIGKNHMSFVWHVAKCCEKANLKSPRGVIFSGDGIVFV